MPADRHRFGKWNGAVHNPVGVPFCRSHGDVKGSHASLAIKEALLIELMRRQRAERRPSLMGPGGVTDLRLRRGMISDGRGRLLSSETQYVRPVAARISHRIFACGPTLCATNCRIIPIRDRGLQRSSQRMSSISNRDLAFGVRMSRRTKVAGSEIVDWPGALEFGGVADQIGDRDVQAPTVGQTELRIRL